MSNVADDKEPKNSAEAGNPQLSSHHPHAAKTPPFFFFGAACFHEGRERVDSCFGEASHQNVPALTDLLSVPLYLQAQKKRVECILAEEATIDGLENVEVKVFK